MQWCCAQELFGSQIPVTTEKFELRIYCIQGSYLTHKAIRHFTNFRGKSHFEDDGIQNCLVFQTTQRYFKMVSNNNDHILSWKSKGLSGESIKPPSIPNNILNASLNKSRI